LRGDPRLPPLVIVHGLRDHSHSFDDLARGLLDRFHVFALDLRGHGDSETTPYYGFGHFLLDLHTLIRALRLERPVLVGHSMGGEIVATYAGCFPDRPAKVVIVEGSAHRRSTWTTSSRGPSTASPASTGRWRATRGTSTGRSASW
jgi:pimeloyl-ACP methyl ester carboxylesterase